MHTYIPSFTTSKQLLATKEKEIPNTYQKRKSIKRVLKNYELGHMIQICELKMSPTTIGLEIAHM